MKNVIVTGAASGIGQATSELFLERNWRVVMVDNKQNKESYDSLKEKHEDVYFFQADVSKYEDIKKLYDFSSEIFEKVDSIIYAAADIKKYENKVI